MAGPRELLLPSPRELLLPVPDPAGPGPAGLALHQLALGWHPGAGALPPKAAYAWEPECVQSGGEGWGAGFQHCGRCDNNTNELRSYARSPIFSPEC